MFFARGQKQNRIHGETGPTVPHDLQDERVTGTSLVTKKLYLAERGSACNPWTRQNVKDHKMTEDVNRQIRLAARPVGLPKNSDWNLVEDTVPTPGPGQVVVRNRFGGPSHARLDE